MTFTEEQQKRHRNAFIEECRQAAWSASCRADWIGKQLDKLMAEYQKLKDEDGRLADEFGTLERALDSHTKDNRDKRRALQDRRNAIAKQLQVIGGSAGQAQQTMQQLYANAEQNLELAAHAEEWRWKEAAQSTDSPPQKAKDSSA